MIAQHPRDGIAVARVADDQRSTEHCAAVPGGKIVQDDHMLAALDGKQPLKTIVVPGRTVNLVIGK